MNVASVSTPAAPAQLPETVANDAARAARRALGAGCAAFLGIARGQVVSATVAGPHDDGRDPFRPYLDGPVGDFPPWGALEASGGMIFACEDGAAAEAGLGEWARRHGIGALIAVDLALPTIYSERLASAGLLIACYPERREIDADDTEAALAIAGVVSLAVSSAALYAEARSDSEANAQAAQEQATLRRIATTVARGAEPGVIFNLVAEEAARLLGGDLGSVARFEDEYGEIVGLWGAGTGLRVRHPLTGDRCMARVARTGRPARVDDYSALRARDPSSREIVPDSYGAGVGVPIRVGDDLWGGILAVRAPGRDPFPPEAERILQRFSDLAALSISSARMRESLEAEANTDPLTGLPNRRLFEQRLKEETARALRYRRELSVAMIDIDHFKAINDTHGHEAGDIALIEVADRLRALARPEETVARIGGEEFAWILPERDALAALGAAERARRSIGGRAIASVGNLTISLGVCSLAEAGGVHALLSRADRALYQAKAEGRDTSCAYSAVRAPATSGAREDEVAARLGARASIMALARTVDAKDRSTRLHSERVSDLAARLAGAAGWSAHGIVLLREAALLHDVGKIGIPDRVLQKKGRLTAAEFAQVRIHPALGAKIAQEVLTAEQAAWIRGHHERWDGTGYPDGLTGEAIPPGARLLALADAWDTMTSDRPYQPPAEIAAALEECAQEAGHQFCPEAVGALQALARADMLVAPEPTGWSL